MWSSHILAAQNSTEGLERREDERRRGREEAESGEMTKINEERERRNLKPRNNRKGIGKTVFST